MDFDLKATDREQIFPLREHYLEELQEYAFNEGRISSDRCRFIAISSEGRPIGYAAYLGEGGWLEKTLLEFYVFPDYRQIARTVFEAVVKTSKAANLITRSNDRLLYSLFAEYCTNIRTTSIHFSLVTQTTHHISSVSFREATPEDTDRLHTLFADPESRPLHREDTQVTVDYINEGAIWILVRNTEVLGAGVLYKTLYQPQYVDLGMLVAAGNRKMGYGAYIVQEMTKVCHQRNLIPAIRCKANNIPFRRTLEKAGYYPYDRYMLGEIEI